MILDIQFIESNQSFDCKFGEINNVSDGGYERGYEKGYEDGFDDGFDDAYKEEQEKSIDITENCTTEVTPDEDMVLSKVIVKVDVPDKSEEIGVIIDQSGVLDSTEGTVEEKVEQLIDKASDENKWYEFIEKLNQTVSNAFINCTFETLPKMNPINVPKMPYWFYGNKYLKKIDFYFNSSKCTDFGRAFLDCSSLESIVGIDTSKAVTVQAMFTRCSALHTIGEIVNGELTNPLDFSSVSTNTQCFDGCTALVNVSFVEESIKKSITIPSPVLSDESVQSIIDGLAYVETSQNLTLNSSVVLRILENGEWTAQISSKNWSVT